MNGRVYSTAYDRFLSPDPLIQDPHYSQSYNRYAYVWNNPLSNVDPTGYRCHGISGLGYSGVSCSAPAYDPYTDQNYIDGTRIDIDYHQPNYHFRQDPYLDQNGLGNFDRLGGGAAPCLGCFPDLGDVLYEGYKDARDALQQWAEEHQDNKEDSKDQAEGALDASNGNSDSDAKNAPEKTFPAPGRPTTADGFDPPRKPPRNADKDGRVKNPNGDGKGWVDAYGDVWVPTGGKAAHGGEHWDVQTPGRRGRRGQHRNVYPEGHVR